MDNEVIIREYEDGDEEGIIIVLQEAFGDWPKVNLSCSKTAFWRWKHQDTPSETNLVHVAKDGDDIVGVSSQHLVPMLIGGKQINASLAGDLAVKKAYRGQGISKELVKPSILKRKEMGINIVYFVTQNPIVIQSHKKRYHSFPHPILNMVRIHDVDLQLKHMPMDHDWIMKTGYRTLNLINRIKNPTSIGHSNIEIDTVTAFPEDTTRLWENNTGIKFMAYNKVDYMNWRYCDPRAGVNKVMLARENGVLVGYIVIQLNRYLRDYPVGYILDLFTDSNKEDIAETLLKTGLEYLDSQNVNIVVSMIPKGHPFERVYASRGFLDSRKNLHLFSSLNQTKEEYLLEGIKPEEIHFSYGAIDSTPISIPKT